ncbi:MAG: hypothetical protein Q7T80_19140 [Methanoregula sp.]|nr:hypothetical protein [Methanoregula sp.]
MSPARHHNPSPITRTLNALSSDPGIVLIAAVVLLAVCLIDTVTPLGLPVYRCPRRTLRAPSAHSPLLRDRLRLFCTVSGKPARTRSPGPVEHKVR